MRSAEETAMRLSLMFYRGGKTRYRVSEKTFTRLSGRRLKNGWQFLKDVQQYCEEFGWGVLEAYTVGGFVAIQLVSLEGAPSLPYVDDINQASLLTVHDALESCMSLYDDEEKNMSDSSHEWSTPPMDDSVERVLHVGPRPPEAEPTGEMLSPRLTK